MCTLYFPQREKESEAHKAVTSNRCLMYSIHNNDAIRLHSSDLKEIIKSVFLKQTSEFSFHELQALAKPSLLRFI